MQRLLVRNRVKDFDVWKAIFDENADAGRAAGLELENLWRCSDEPENVFFIFTVADREKADAFMADPSSAETGQRSGVIDGECWYIE